MGEAGPVRREDHGAVAALLIGAAPVNVLSLAVVQALHAAVETALTDAAIGAVLIRAVGRSFPLDAEFAEGEASDPPGPALSSLCALIEAAEKPVVMALHGSVLGAALSLALAAHARIATEAAQFGFPDVTLGLMPAAGATQRAPRLIGGEQALRLMLTGRPVGAAEALALGLLDKVTAEGLEAAALAMAQDCAGRRLTASRDRGDGLRDGAGFQRAVAAARARAGGGRLPAPQRIVDCIEAAQLLPFEAGLEFEAAAAADLRGSPESAGLRHVYQAERRAARFPELAMAQPAARPMQRLGILGALADDLVLPALSAGMEVILVDADRQALVQSLERIAGEQQRAVAAGKLTPARRDANWGRLGTVADPAALAGCDAVILGAPELLAAAVAATPPGLLIGLSLPGDVAEEEVPADRAADLLGFHPGGHRFVEIAVRPRTAAAQVLAALALARAIGFTALRTEAPGGVAARLMATGRGAVARVLAGGEAPAAVAAALSGFGLTGLIPLGARPEPTPAARAERIMQRVVTAMANEGARILSEGLVARPSDIDFAVVSGAGFPRWQGGPMHWADRRGLLLLRRDLSVWTWEAPELWTIEPLIAELVEQGRCFADLDHG